MCTHRGGTRGSEGYSSRGTPELPERTGSFVNRKGKRQDVRLGLCIMLEQLIGVQSEKLGLRGTER